MHGPGVPDSGRASRGSGILTLCVVLLASPSGYVGATGTASTSVVTIGEGYTGGISGQTSSDDHVGEVGLPATT
jgi:hypothetical protein